MSSRAAPSDKAAQPGGGGIFRLGVVAILAAPAYARQPVNRTDNGRRAEGSADTKTLKNPPPPRIDRTTHTHQKTYHTPGQAKREFTTRGSHESDCRGRQSAAAVLAAPAYAEETPVMSQQRDIDKAKAAATDKAYKDAIKNTAQPPKPVKIDPWSNARETAPKAANSSPLSRLKSNTRSALR